ncbi:MULTISPECIES: GntR family transcriptional regulator [Sporosarcina]|uniref:GntR family transcriptional regulator n=1 Tax=Sporosarcina TaxID=1569 RepID=UPI00078BFCC0|nr:MULTISPECIES: GntR family transcriptional regulator [Sporosarcina]AMQ05918.1 GntR family transcriptional regulator [Sporosarcina psychrophila]QNK89874.1 GntR family transcriptional regulator [Sporosarcina sp. resist]
MLPIRLSKDSREPIYHQIEKQLKALIAGGHLPAGTPLPSIRVLSKDLEISVITIRRAYQDLESQGFIETVHGKGTFVAEIQNSMKQETMTASVQTEFERAIRNAMDYDYTVDEIKTVFEETLEKLAKGE